MDWSCLDQQKNCTNRKRNARALEDKLLYLLEHFAEEPHSVGMFVLQKALEDKLLVFVDTVNTK
jgi:hypothetical protein